MKFDVRFCVYYKLYNHGIACVDAFFFFFAVEVEETGRVLSV